MSNSALLAELRPVLQEFAAACVGRESVCLTLEVEGNRRVWIQLLEERVNAGLYDGEDRSLIQQSLKKHGLVFTEGGFEQGVFFEITLPGQRDERFVHFLHDVLGRHQRGRPCALQVKIEEL